MTLDKLGKLEARELGSLGACQLGAFCLTANGHWTATAPPTWSQRHDMWGWAALGSSLPDVPVVNGPWSVTRWGRAAAACEAMPLWSRVNNPRLECKHDFALPDETASENSNSGSNSNHDAHVTSSLKVANLDFEARVPVPFSIFPSSYRDNQVQTTTAHTHQELDIKLPNHQQEPAGRQEQYSSYTAHVDLPPREEKRYSQEEVRITEERHRRPGFQQDQFIKEDFRDFPKSGS
ncbi:hypothetical protein E4U54_008000 [Claviceps lovelessii]|nr:hypothetical protein E4U54_008000 [Claviceps lovelessii]